MSGILVIITDFVIYYALILAVPFAVAKAVSFILSGVLSYYLNKYWTFRQSVQSSQEVVRFILANACALGINVASNEALLRISGKSVSFALLTATMITAVFAFIVFKFWVFKMKG